MATPYETLEKEIGVLASPIAAYIAAILEEQEVDPTPDPTPDPEPEPEPTPEPEPQPTTPTLPSTADTDTVFQIVDYTGGDYVHGISVKDNAVLLRLATAVKAGLKLRFKNGQGSIIVSNTATTIGGVVLSKVVVGAITLAEALGGPGSVTLYGMTTTPAPTPEPTPTPTPEPTPTVQYKNIPMGVNGHEGRELTYPAAQMEDRLKLLNENNIRVYRAGGELLNKPDKWSELDRLIALAKKYNITLRPMVYPTTEAQAYNYAKTFGDRIKVFEIGNEADIIKVDAEREAYITAMGATYKGMKRASDEFGLGLKFTCNVTATNTRDKNNKAYGDANGPTWFFDKVAAAGFKFDYISFHYYPSAYDTQSDWFDFYMSQVVAHAKRTGAPVFLNEYNVGETYRLDANGKPMYNGTQQICVDSLRASLTALQKYKDVIREICVYELLDEPNQAGVEANFGLRTTLANKKPTFDVVAQFAKETVTTTTPAFQRRTKGKVAVNGAVGAGADHVTPGIEGTNYTMLKPSEMDRIKSYGITDIRVGFLEGRVFPEAANPLKYWQGNDVTQPTWGRVMTLDHLIRIGEQAADRGMTIMLDNHSYGYFPSNGAPNRALLGSAGNTVDMWVERQFKLLSLLKSNPKAWSAIKRYDVINEPYMSEHNAAFLAAAYQKLLDRCGPLTGTDLIYVFEGPAYSSMSRWAELVGDNFDNLTHPNGRAYIEFSAHGYLDAGKDGYFDENKDGIINEADQVLANGETWATLAIGRAKGFVEWAIRKNFNVSVGESIVPGNLPLFLKAFDELLTYLLDNGVTVYIFAVGDSIDKKSEHNLETTKALSGGVVDNTNTLALVVSKAKIYNV